MNHLIQKPGLTDKTRIRMLAVWDGDNRLLPYLFQMENLVRQDEVLKWLIDRKIVGKKFMTLILENQGSLLKTISFILMKINKDLEPKPIIVGRDIR